MRKLIVIFASVLLAITVTAAPASAAVKFHSGPTAVDNGTTLTVTGNVSGLGNENLDVLLDAVGTATVTCTNPAGNVAPGQRTTVDATGSQTGIEPKNGRATFSVTTLEPADPDPAEACPNRKWTADIIDVQFTSYTLTLMQGGEIIFERTYQR